MLSFILVPLRFSCWAQYITGPSVSDLSRLICGLGHSDKLMDFTNLVGRIKTNGCTCANTRTHGWYEIWVLIIIYRYYSRSRYSSLSLSHSRYSSKMRTTLSLCCSQAEELQSNSEIFSFFFQAPSILNEFILTP